MSISTDNRYTFLTIVRYPTWFAWAGFLSMAVFHLFFLFRKDVLFYKLLGCGKNGSFSAVPDVRQYVILVVLQEPVSLNFDNYLQLINGKVVVAWWKYFRCKYWCVSLLPIEGHGSWDGKTAFGNLPKNSAYEGEVAVLTRATIRLSRLKHFWSHVGVVSKHLPKADGLITYIGIGEVPYIKQATFSIWQSKQSMKNFAYDLIDHTTVIKKTRTEKWYSEDLFVRFKVLDYTHKPGEYKPIR